jgi:hypothetical protein
MITRKRVVVPDMNHLKRRKQNICNAQFYPRMAVYNDVEGWQNMQFWEASSLCHLEILMLTSPFPDHATGR